MFNDIENTLLDNGLQACLIGDCNAHTGNVSEYVVIDNNILDVNGPSLIVGSNIKTLKSITDLNNVGEISA
jgi:hypothetical protein